MTRAAALPSVPASLKGVSVSEPSDDERLRQLEDRIAKLRGDRQKPVKSHQEEHYSQAQIAWRMVTELVAGLGIGFGIGYGIDSLVGTRPVFMVLFLLLGFAAGVQTMMRTAKEVQADRRNATAGQDGAPGSGAGTE